MQASDGGRAKTCLSRPGVGCGQQGVHLSEEVSGHDCQPANWWGKFAAKYEKQGVKCSGNATGCSRSCA